jgi:glycosyltransferase involved in cell wall biosynthesis
MPAPPRVSVITPCYNAARFIRSTIESLEVQTFPSWEHIVVDDGSTDDSAAVVACHVKEEPRLRLVRQANAGVCAARNAGAAAADAGSEYLLFLDADDELEPHALATLIGYLDGHPDVGLAYCAYRYIDAAGQLVATEAGAPGLRRRYVPSLFGPRQLQPAERLTPLEALMAYHDAIPATCLIRKRTFEQTDRWDPHFRIFADKDMVVQLALCAPVHFVPEYLVRYRRHEANMSHQDGTAELRRLSAKWWYAPRLAPAARTRVRHAVLFDLELTAVFQLRGAAHALKQRHWKQGTRLALQGARKVGAFSLAYARWTWERAMRTPLGLDAVVAEPAAQYGSAGQ